VAATSDETKRVFGKADRLPWQLQYPFLSTPRRRTLLIVERDEKQSMCYPQIRYRRCAMKHEDELTHQSSFHPQQ
jgi:hypothetical protein